ECTKKTRPPAKARFGSVCERLFGTTNTQFVYCLSGNTQITRDVRVVTASVDPKNCAVWTLGRLYDRLCEWAPSSMTPPALPRSDKAPATALPTVSPTQVIGIIGRFDMTTSFE